MRILFYWLLVPVLALGLAASPGLGMDGEPGRDDPEDDLGESSVQLTGPEPYNASFSGIAIFSENPDFDASKAEVGFALVLHSGATPDYYEGASDFIRLDWIGARPEPGSYPIRAEPEGDGPFGVFWTAQTAAPEPFIVSPREGTLTITSSSSSRIEGSLSFTGPIEMQDRSTGETGTVTGTFEAVFVEPQRFP